MISISIRGIPDRKDLAVLTTRTDTFQMKEWHTSNTIVLLEPVNSAPDAVAETTPLAQRDALFQELAVRDTMSTIWELTKIAPNLDRLRQLLSHSMYRGALADAERHQQHDVLYTFSDLQERIQASDAEIRSGLDALHAIELNGGFI